MYKRRQELVNLQNKVNQLYSIVKQLGEYIGWEGIEKISLCDLEINQYSKLNNDQNKNIDNLSNNQLINDISIKDKNNLNIHKDILMDDEAIYSELSDYTQELNNISCEEQVYRLTAQLTAAYHRIASLEDQLLAIRSHVETRNDGFYHVQ